MTTINLINAAFNAAVVVLLIAQRSNTREMMRGLAVTMLSVASLVDLINQAQEPEDDDSLKH